MEILCFKINYHLKDVFMTKVPECLLLQVLYAAWHPFIALRILFETLNDLVSCPGQWIPIGMKKKKKRKNPFPCTA